MKAIKTTRSLSWIGFAPAIFFIFGKFAGFISWSWWWIIITLVMVYPRKIKEESNE